MSFDSAAAMLQSIERESLPPSGISGELHALWLAKKGEWHGAHDIVSNIHTAMGSWIHAYLHVLEGDLGNAAYWYRKAGKSPRPPEQSDEEWLELVEENL
jgi:hypothetical protein